MKTIHLLKVLSILSDWVIAHNQVPEEAFQPVLDFFSPLMNMWWSVKINQALIFFLASFLHGTSSCSWNIYNLHHHTPTPLSGMHILRCIWLPMSCFHRESLGACPIWTIIFHPLTVPQVEITHCHMILLAQSDSPSASSLLAGSLAQRC